MSRFDYVKYDEFAFKLQAAIKIRAEELEALIDTLPESRPKSLAMTKLEEVYAWCGKAIRDNQIDRNNGTVRPQEERENG